MSPGAKAVVEAKVAAKVGVDPEPRAVHEAKAECGAEAEEGPKVMLAVRVEQEAKAGPAVWVGAGAEAGRVTYGARVKSGGLRHEVVVVKRAMAKTKKERGAPATATAAVII